MTESLHEMFERIYGKRLPLEESNALATKIVEIGGTWLIGESPYQVEVTPIGATKSWDSRTLVTVKALKGKPWREKVDFGEGRTFRQSTDTKNILPQYLTQKEEK